MRKAGDGIKFLLKQCLKMTVQNIILPLVYFIFKSRKIKRGLVIFADAHNDECPVSMRCISDRFKSDYDYSVIEFYHDFSRCGSFRSLIYSIQFMRLYAKAELVFICDNFLPVSACKKRKGTLVVQLWHACGAFKKFGYDTAGDIPKYYKGNVYKNYDLVTVSSGECIKHFASAMRLDESVFKALGVSRTDIYFDEDFIEKSKERFYSENPNAKGKKVALWAPTFRGNPSEPYLEGNDAVDRLADELSQSGEWYFVTKPHPHIKNSVIADTGSDIPTEMLFAVVDLLITDYSSVIYEYSLFKKPILIFAPDLEKYKAQRGFYIDIQNLPADIITDSECLTKENIEKAVSQFDESKMQSFIERYMNACDGNSTKRIIEYVKEIKMKVKEDI